MRGKLRAISILWGVYVGPRILVKAILFGEISSVFFIVSFNRKIARYGIVTVMFRSIAMDL